MDHHTAYTDQCPNCGTTCGPTDIIRVDHDGQRLCIYYCPTCRGASWEVAYWAPTPRTEKDL